SFGNAPLRNPRTSLVTSNATIPVWRPAIVAVSVAGLAHGFGGSSSIDQREAPEQLLRSFDVRESIAQFHVAPSSVHARVSRNTLATRAERLDKSLSLSRSSRLA